MRPIVLYGSETRILKKVKEIRFVVFERKFSRRVYGPSVDSDTMEWRIYYNEELKNIFQLLDIIIEIMKRRLI